MKHSTTDQATLLRWQRARVKYDMAVLLQIDDVAIEGEYIQTLMALQFEDATLADLARTANGLDAQRSEVARVEILARSYDVADLFPTFSRLIH